MIFALPQMVLSESLNVMVGVLQLSVAVARPVTLVVVTAGHSRMRLVGQMMTGVIVSLTVIVWVQLD